MAFSRQLAVIGILGACFCVAVGCDDDGDKIANAGDAGEGGEDGGGKSGSGGKSTGGSNNTSGNGGTAPGGSANDAGAGGEPVAGGGGTAPVGGGAGDGGTVASGGAGAGGDGGAAGAGGGAPLAKTCSDQCETTAECAVDGLLAVQKVCDPVVDRCVQPFINCAAHGDCVPWASGFLKTCATQADCDDVFAVCVNFQGSGYCATQPNEGFCFGDPPGGMPSQLPEFGDPDPNMIDVCVNTEGRCDEGSCFLGCTGSGGCEDSGNGDTCNDTTGLCECAAGSECDSDVCGADSHCVECVTDAHCAANLDGRTTCVAGTCGCGSSDSCPDNTFGGTPVCE